MRFSSAWHERAQLGVRRRGRSCRGSLAVRQLLVVGGVVAAVARRAVHVLARVRAGLERDAVGRVADAAAPGSHRGDAAGFATRRSAARGGAGRARPRAPRRSPRARARRAVPARALTRAPRTRRPASARTHSANSAMPDLAQARLAQAVRVRGGPQRQDGQREPAQQQQRAGDPRGPGNVLHDHVGREQVPRRPRARGASSRDRRARGTGRAAASRASRAPRTAAAGR